jgi:ribosomal protein S18 acetylase RimI-like enzyme
MAEEPSLARRVAVHRAAFHPSRVTEESYANVVRTWPYRPELDCFVEAPDGTLAAYALAWYDDTNRVGELEPVGTHPDHRRRGLGRAVNLFALRHLRSAGATIATVACRGDDSYPVPRRLYRSVGFRELTRTVPFVKEVAGVVRPRA